MEIPTKFEPFGAARVQIKQTVPLYVATKLEGTSAGPASSLKLREEATPNLNKSSVYQRLSASLPQLSALSISGSSHTRMPNIEGTAVQIKQLPPKLATKLGGNGGGPASSRSEPQLMLSAKSSGYQRLRITLPQRPIHCRTCSSSAMKRNIQGADSVQFRHLPRRRATKLRRFSAGPVSSPSSGPQEILPFKLRAMPTADLKKSSGYQILGTTPPEHPRTGSNPDMVENIQDDASVEIKDPLTQKHPTKLRGIGDGPATSPISAPQEILPLKLRARATADRRNSSGYQSLPTPLLRSGSSPAMAKNNQIMSTAYSTDPTTVLSCFTSLCSLEPDTFYLNDILNDKPDPSLICRNCDEISKATSRCKDCEELLCNSCVKAHVRVKLTKDHCIIPLEDNNVSPSTSAYSCRPNPTISGAPSNGSSPNSIYSSSSSLNCDLHLTETIRMYCETCGVVFCKECNTIEHRTHACIYFNEALERARNSSVKMISNANMSAQSAKECLEISQRMLDTVNIRTQSISREISNMMRRFRMAIEDRERELLAKVERIRVYKYRAIQQQVESFRTLFACFSHSSKTLSDALEVGGPLEIIHIKDSISAELDRLRAIRSNLPHIDDTITVVPPDSAVLLAISAMGDITTTYTPTAIGDEMFRKLTFRPPSGYHQPNSRVNTYLDNLSVPDSTPMLVQPEKPFSEGSKFPLWTGYRSKEKNNFVPIPTRIRYPITNGENQNNNFIPHRDYTEAGKPVFIIGGEGEKEGKLCRPWGVCCTAEGNIVVADRSNNRIQIFKPDGTFLRKFGTHGTEPGFFDRPAGVAVDPLGRIVVTDKDNHRVQIFSQDGGFVYTFGEKGSKICQFNYPWDIDVDSHGRIVVSDTRNHRIQLFDSEGGFIAKYGFENTSNMVKHFDSPRGVCFGVKGCVIATDFNNHRLVVVDPNFRNAKFLGGEGCGEKQFLRPQGVVVDPAGNIIVADSRNNRIQIFEQNGSYLYEFGSPGKEPGQLDRPSGVCLTPDGKIVVVDFGNNRVQVF